MINCRGALIWRKQNLTKADFKERKSFSSARQVIIPLQLGAIGAGQEEVSGETFPGARSKESGERGPGVCAQLAPIPAPTQDAPLGAPTLPG